MNILVTGKDGQLGSELQELSSNSKHTFFFYGSDSCDITNIQSVATKISEHTIDAIINCAAYTAVDAAEDNPDIAKLVNYNGVKNLNDLAEKHGLKLVHISTDYVFNGEGKSPYKTDDQVSPIGIYGITKHLGEDIIINSKTDAIVIRTSWVYSSFGQNFVKTMRRLGSERDQLGVVADQVGSPTYARDLADAILTVLDAPIISANQRIYHFSNLGEISWFDFAKAIMQLSGLKCEVSPITTDQFPTKAKRPKYSVLDTSDIYRDFSIQPKNWHDSLEACIKLLD